MLGLQQIALYRLGRSGQGRAQTAQPQPQSFAVAVAELGGFIEGKAPAHIAQGPLGDGKAVLAALDTDAFFHARQIARLPLCLHGGQGQDFVAALLIAQLAGLLHAAFSDIP